MATNEQEPRHAAMRCMELLFELHAAIMDHNVTIGELVHVMRLAISEGHDVMMVTLSMARIALERAQAGGSQ